LLWRPLVGDIAEEREINGMPLSPGQIVALARHAVHVAQLSGEGELTVERVRRSARELNRGRTANASPDPTTRLADLVLPPDALQEIQRLLDWARQRDDVPARRLLPGKGGKGSGITALFAGPPGTGKTLAAHIIADSLGMDLHQIDLSSVIDKYIGETEKHLERAFTDAESTNALLFFDEADALFGARSGVRDAKDRYANQEVAYLLQRIEQFDGITVLASNLRGNIDPAFARRLHFIIAFPPPDRPTRRTLWARHLAGIPADPADPVDVERLADQEDLSGGDIRNIVLAATYASVAAGTGIGMRHLRDALHREYLKLGRRPTRIA
jgi:SpoVK/Ycf46/Vps4 family AAA+-type ATPase